MATKNTAAKTAPKTPPQVADAAAEETKNLPAVQAANALAELSEDDFAADAGAGMEGADSDSYAIPFLVILQSNSPQVDEASGTALEGARAGMIYNNVTGELMAGKVDKDGNGGVEMVQAYFRREFLRWQPRETGGGFKGAFQPEAVAAMRAKGEVKDLDGRLFIPDEKGAIDPKKCDRMSDTRAHFVLYKSHRDGEWHPAMLSLASTQIRKSRQLMAALADVRVTVKGQRIQPASFASRFRVTTIPESNDKGNWMGARIELIGLTDSATYAAAREFYKQAKAGSAEVRYEAPVETDGGAGSGGGVADEKF